MVSLKRKQRGVPDDPSAPAPSAPSARATMTMPSVPIPDGDPLASLLLGSSGPVDLKGLELVSPTVDKLRDAGVDLVVPLIGQGELMGALYLGPRLSDQPYSTDDRRLLGALAGQVAPAIRVAQLVQEQQSEAKERERIQQELRVAALIQQTLLPRELPQIRGWNIDAFYRPARAVGGDFYDFIPLHGGRLGVVIGDVTDKGVPAALVMATCRSMLRSAALQHDDPTSVLTQVNELLVPEIPPAMFVTCLYAIIDTDSGAIEFANAGHNLPYVRTEDGVVELRATGMPLGLMPGMTYEQADYVLPTGSVVVLTSDGITEAHNDDGEMYGFGRLMGQVGEWHAEGETVSGLISDLEAFTGPDREQEDDITLVVIRRTSSARVSAEAYASSSEAPAGLLASFTLPSIDGNERLAIDRVQEVVAGIEIARSRLDRLKTAVAETVMNAIEHGNLSQADLEVGVEVFADEESITIRVSDSGAGNEPEHAETPDLEAKLAGDQSPRGWGLFLIEKMVDRMRTFRDEERHIVELVMSIRGDT